MQVLGRLAHEQGLGVDQLLRDDAGVGVDALTHGMPAHVLDAAGDDQVVGADTDATGQVGDGGHRARAHAVDRLTGHRPREVREESGRAPQGQPLVADLGRGRDGHVVDAVRRQRGIAAQQLTEDGHDEVVGAGLGVDAGGTGLAERSAGGVDQDDVTHGTGGGHGHSSHSSRTVGYRSVMSDATRG